LSHSLLRLPAAALPFCSAAGRTRLRRPAPAPVAQLETIDILVVNDDIGPGQTLSARDLRRQTWPAAVAAPAFIRRSDRPDPANQVARTGTLRHHHHDHGEITG